MIQTIRKTLREQVLSYEKNHVEDDDWDIAHALVTPMSTEELTQLATEMVAEWVWTARRIRQLEAELAAEHHSWDTTQAQLRNTKAANQVSDYERVFSDPLTLTRGDVLLTNQRARDAFATWCGPRFEEWSRRAHDAVLHGEANTVKRENFFEDWHPGGQRARFYERLSEQLSAMIQTEAKRIRLQLTDELLNSVFALGDGKRVTWGSATRSDHEQRIVLLTKNATANIATAARHMAAINMMDAAGAGSLGQIE